MRRLSEEIARSHQTVDNDPIQYDEHEEVDVEMYANDMLVEKQLVGIQILKHPK